jgi:DNA-binding Lrp family transcriptional regulator
MRRASNRQWVLKPQDLAVALKLVALKGSLFSYAALAKQLRLSPFEVHAAVQRLVAAKLAVDIHGAIRPNYAALRGFVLYGAVHAYPPVEGEITIGFPTAHAVAPMNSRVQDWGDLPPVWPHPEGPVRGTALLPLYEKLPLAAQDDRDFHELLALFDALRIGQAREREMARQLLEERLQ